MSKTISHHHQDIIESDNPRGMPEGKLCGFRLRKKASKLISANIIHSISQDSSRYIGRPLIELDESYSGNQSSKKVRHIQQIVKFEGWVEELHEDSFIAIFHNVSSPDDHKEAEILLSDLSAADQKLVGPGASFIWTISYHHNGSTKRRISEFYFRRKMVFLDRNIEQKVKSEVDGFVKTFGW